MDSEINKYICILICFIVGVFIFYLIKSYCGCKVIVEGQIQCDNLEVESAIQKKKTLCDNLNFFTDQGHNLLQTINQSPHPRSQYQNMKLMVESLIPTSLTSSLTIWRGIVPKYICDITKCTFKPYFKHLLNLSLSPYISHFLIDNVNRLDRNIVAILLKYNLIKVNNNSDGYTTSDSFSNILKHLGILDENNNLRENDHNMLTDRLDHIFGQILGYSESSCVDPIPGAICDQINSKQIPQEINLPSTSIKSTRSWTNIARSSIASILPSSVGQIDPDNAKQIKRVLCTGIPSSGGSMTELIITTGSEWMQSTFKLPFGSSDLCEYSDDGDQGTCSQKSEFYFCDCPYDSIISESEPQNIISYIIEKLNIYLPGYNFTEGNIKDILDRITGGQADTIIHSLYMLIILYRYLSDSLTEGMSDGYIIEGNSHDLTYYIEQFLKLFVYVGVSFVFIDVILYVDCVLHQKFPEIIPEMGINCNTLFPSLNNTNEPSVPPAPGQPPAPPPELTPPTIQLGCCVNN